MHPQALTNFHCHTSIDCTVENTLTAEAYPPYLDDEMKRVVLTDHGFIHYLGHDPDTVWKADWTEKTELFDAVRPLGDASIQRAIQRTRALANPNVFVGIETDMMKDGRLTHSPELTDAFDLILCGCHFLPWIARLESMEARITAWLDHIDAMLDKPEIDAYSHPFRWIGNMIDYPLPDDAVDRVIRWADERNLAMELNSKAWVPEAATVRLLRAAADRGIPIIVGTDAHRHAEVKAFGVARERLALAGLTLNDLYVPEVEDFIARKGKRHTRESRPRRSRGPVATNA
jgi:histidinol phosphatase-like PHP family hydrolase